MGKVIFNLVMIVITGYALIVSYYHLIDAISNNQSKETQSLSRAINDLRSKHKSLSMNEVNHYDKEHGTNLSLAINKVRSNYMINSVGFAQSPSVPIKPDSQHVESFELDLIQAESISKAGEIKYTEQDFWSYLPSFYAIVFSGIGVFFATFIANFANTCYEKLYDLLLGMYRSLKIRKNK